MGLESSFNFIDDLNSTNPAAGDDISEGDDHLRGTKNAVKGSFPSLGSAAVTKTAAQINDLVDKSTTQTISGAKTFTANVLLEKAEPQLLIKCADEATENTVIRFLDETDVSRSLLFRPAGTDKVRLDARDSLGVTQAALELTEAGDVSVAAGTLRATNAILTTPSLVSPVINTGVSGTAVKDEDDMASDSATHLATQQSIKAYVDDLVQWGRSSPGGGGGTFDSNTAWTTALIGTGLLRVTHNLGNNAYVVTATVETAAHIVSVTRATNSFDLTTTDSSASVANATVHWHLIKNF